MDTEAEVVKDILARQRRGVSKYGVTVANNPLPLQDWLQHQYEELLDAAIYCKRAIQEMQSQAKDAELRRLHDEVQMLQEQNTYLDHKLAELERKA